MSANPVPFAGVLPLDPERAARLETLVGDLDSSALMWISGYTAGLAAERARHAGGSAGLAGALMPGSAAAAAPRAAPVQRATILYGSQTGNGRRLAERLGRSLEVAGLAARVVNAADYPPRQLAQERFLYLVVSTHGDGDPPDDIRPLFELLASRRAPRLESLSYAVLALGDSSYPQFCATGRLFDDRLAALGAAAVRTRRLRRRYRTEGRPLDRGGGRRRPHRARHGGPAPRTRDPAAARCDADRIARSAGRGRGARQSTHHGP
jgi:sulfite reductase (NADPH) flavoprotein alpha-component